MVSSYFQIKKRSGHKELKVVASEPEAQSVFYNLGKRFHGGKCKGVHSRLEMKATESLSLEVIRS